MGSLFPNSLNVEHRPELLPEVRPEVLSEQVVVLQAGQQEATALEEQHRLRGSEGGVLQVGQNHDHLLGLVTDEGHLQRGER